LPLNGRRWFKYLQRIAESLEVSFKEGKIYKTIDFKVNGSKCEILISAIKAKVRM